MRTTGTLFLLCVVVIISLIERSQGFTSELSRRSSFRTPITVRSSTAVKSEASTLQASNTNELLPLRRGSTVALITPLKENGDIHEEDLRNLIRWHVESGTDNLCLLGTTAEASSMNMEDRATVLRIGVEEAKGKVPMMVGTGTIDPVKVKAMTQQAADMGADAALVVTPYYVKPPQRCLVQHMIDAADWNLLPVVVYNIPGRSIVDMTDESLAICAQHSNIAALKDATGDLDRVSSLKALLKDANVADDDFLLYSGDDSSSLDFVNRGGHGCISVSANVVPALMHKIMTQPEDAKEWNTPLMKMHSDLFIEASPMPVKYALKLMGRISSDICRKPLDRLDAQYESAIQEALKQANVSIN